MLALAVSLSVLGLAVGPLLLAWGRGRALPSAAMEGLTLGLVPAVVLLRLLPHVYEEAGVLAIALLAAGYVSVWIVERRRHRALGEVGQVVALPALIVHATVDGATLGVALTSAEIGGGGILAAALLVHRVPEGLFVARALVPEIGWRRTIAWLAVLALATVAGALLGEHVLGLAPHQVFHGIVAVGLGAILRLVTHTHERTPHTQRGVIVFVIALLAGFAINAAVPSVSLPDLHAEPARDAHTATLVGGVALFFVVALGLVRFAPRSWRSKLGPALDHDHDHDHAHGHDHPHEHGRDHDHEEAHEREGAHDHDHERAQVYEHAHGPASAPSRGTRGPG